MKNVKLNLKDLQVKSFVTDLDHTNAKTVKGGTIGQISGRFTCTVGAPCTHMTCPTDDPCLPSSTISSTIGTHNPE